MMSDVIVFRVDCSARIGMGHVMRCIALAQAFREQQVGAVFVIQDDSGCGAAMVRASGFPLVLLPSSMDVETEMAMMLSVFGSSTVKRVVCDLNHSLVLADISRFCNLLKGLDRKGVALTVIEGMRAECISGSVALPAQLILVPYVGASKEGYKLSPGARVLAGEKYFFFREDFIKTSVKKDVRSRACCLLVSMGGGDVGRMNEKVLEAVSLLGRNDLKVKVTGVVGEDMRRRIPRLEVIASSDDMPALLAWADLLVTSSGLTRYEAAFMGTPAVVLSLNHIHATMVELFAKTGCIRHAGLFEEVAAEQFASFLGQLLDDGAGRLAMSQQGQKLLDGQGGRRVVREILNGG